MVRWTDLREELERETGCSPSRLNRLLTKLTTRGEVKFAKVPGSNARQLEDVEVDAVRKAARELATQPVMMPSNFSRPAKPKAAAPAAPASTDDDLTVEHLAASEGPKNTRKSLAAPKADEEDEKEDSDEKKGGKKSLVTWLVIGGALVAFGVIAFGYVKRRRALAAAYVPPAQEPAPEDDGYVGGGGDFSGGDMQSYVDEIRRRAVGR